MATRRRTVSARLRTIKKLTKLKRRAKKAENREKRSQKGRDLAIYARPERDFVAVAIDYANEAVADEQRLKFCELTRLACSRFLSDLEKAKAEAPPFYWNPDKAAHVCRFIEELHHVEGRWETGTITLEPAQIFFLCNLFGFRTASGARRFTTALYSVARKNAKSTLAAAILLYCMVEEDEIGPQVLSAATTGSQARIVWGVAKRMVEKNHDLREYYNVDAFAHSILCYGNGGTFKAINAKASTQDGLNPSAVCLDEVHAHKTHDLYNVLRSAAGARESPLFLYTTTEGFESSGPWNDVRGLAMSVLKGIVQADHFLAIIYGLDDEDDDFDESKWIKANPLLGVSVKLEKLREYAVEAKQQPGVRAEFRIKRLNRRASSAKSWTDLTLWKRCAGTIPFEDLANAECWASIDLASTQDMVAYRFLWRKNGRYYTWGRFFVPEEAVRHRTERGTTRYEPWVEGGYLKQTEGNVIDYETVEDAFVEDMKKFKPKKVAYDSWNATASIQRMEKLVRGSKIEFVQFIQGTRSYSPAMRECDVAYRSGILTHEDNPILTWNMSNLVARTDPNQNTAPDKSRSSEKIDGAVALFMTFGLAALEVEPKKPSFQMIVLSQR